ncbi:DMT family transporter [Dechloromonas sp.]|uniref:DMT family transporter n=1 Tax=Dechloromonas sp. TaxID=1917218 RepID=UPI0012261AB3|nr:DMT family transporter [Dechloromonas sp.]MBU3697055.1 DMT family transporter [Dechloromonas sp.]TEX49445.1 MAG: EamA family transporter [Rhodocyclaceae bacterium]
MSETRTLTYGKLVAAMAMWGGTWIAGRVIAQELAAPLAVASLRFVLAGLVVAAVMLASEGSIPLPQGRQAWTLVWALGFFGIFLYGLCFFFGLQRIPAGRGALVVALNPVVIVLLAWLLGKERMTLKKAFGSLIAFAGCLTVIGNGDPLALLQGSVGLGEWLIIGCVVSWAAYTFIGWQATGHFSALATTLYASFTGATLLGLAALVQGDIHPLAWSWRVWAGMSFLAIFGTAIAYTWFTAAVQRLGAGHASVFINLVPVFAVLQAAVLLDERLGLPVLFGGLLVIAGVTLATLQKTTLEKTT